MFVPANEIKLIRKRRNSRNNAKDADVSGVQFPRREIYESTSPVFRFSNCMIDAGGGERRPFPVDKAGRTVFAGGKERQDGWRSEDDKLEMNAPQNRQTTNRKAGNNELLKIKRFISEVLLCVSPNNRERSELIEHQLARISWEYREHARVECASGSDRVISVSSSAEDVNVPGLSPGLEKDERKDQSSCGTRRGSLGRGVSRPNLAYDVISIRYQSLRLLKADPQRFRPSLLLHKYATARRVDQHRDTHAPHRLCDSLHLHRN
ncbi:hypothetical protein GEV33_014242 [Tenebrio molitor]|uniref:Uncharacterized protein n=1 Tax=Tenebrio molitor TaxID=7067 RepID=A0A8J6H734_TENMO|nr:hypothetical protein GEV33_014242 [Tenebrio molitor]